jgi:PilZ domain
LLLETATIGLQDVRPSFGTLSGTLASLTQQFFCFRHGGEAFLRTLIRHGVSFVGCYERRVAVSDRRLHD